MPAKGAADPPADPGRAAAYHRAPSEELVAAAGRLRTRGRREYPSQAAFLTAIRREIARSDPDLRIGPRRLRRLLLSAGLVRLRIVYSRRTDAPPVVGCPVCGEALRPLVNRTLENERVTVGHACPLCGYWTHRARRVPTRYTVLLRGR